MRGTRATRRTASLAGLCAATTLLLLTGCVAPLAESDASVAPPTAPNTTALANSEEFVTENGMFQISIDRDWILDTDPVDLNEPTWYVGESEGDVSPTVVLTQTASEVGEGPLRDAFQELIDEGFAPRGWNAVESRLRRGNDGNVQLRIEMTGVLPGSANAPLRAAQYMLANDKTLLVAMFVTSQERWHQQAPLVLPYLETAVSHTPSKQAPSTTAPSRA